MPRRVLSASHWYHITSRSAGRIQLFEDDDDRRYYLRLLKESRDTYCARLFAWVLMSDHVHLLVTFDKDPADISDFMWRINSRYSRYFNNKTDRSGTLFQNKYWSKPVLTDGQLIATAHYIHMNPETAGIAPMRSYRWSSYQEYVGKHWVVDTSVLLDMFGSFEAFDSYQGSADDVIKEARLEKLSDDKVLAIALSLSGFASSTDLRKLPTSKRGALICQLSNQGISTHKIARTFGIGHSTVSRVLKTKMGQVTR